MMVLTLVRDIFHVHKFVPFPDNDVVTNNGYSYCESCGKVKAPHGTAR